MESLLISFMEDITSIRQQYAQTGQLDALRVALTAFAEKHRSLALALPNSGWPADVLLNMGDGLIREGDMDGGMCFIRTAATQLPPPNNKTLLYLRLAAHHLEKGETEAGKACLVKLCTDTVDNYEEAIALNELTPLWEKYKPLVAGEIPPSVSFHTAAAPLPPEKCTMQIGDILALPREDILAALSSHLAERSANGEMIQCLNKWEKTVFYPDELMMEVNSGGFDSYLYYHGTHFEKALQTFTAIGAAGMLGVMGAVAAKFPRGRLPKTLDSIQNRMDAMADAGIDFEAEDDAYYTSAEKELIEALTDFILENRSHFR